MTVSEKLRLVQGLHSHAEMFGFNWNDGSDWTWHDVACKIADEVDAENAKLRSQCADLVDERERLFRANVEKNGEILRLVGENANLREYIERKQDLQNFARLVTENSKLRELCREIYEDQCCDGDQWKYRDRMRELGVEVDDD